MGESESHDDLIARELGRAFRAQDCLAVACVLLLVLVGVTILGLRVVLG